MEYRLPKEISQTSNVTLKTVYNYIKRYSDKIRTKKEYGKTFVHFKDFEQAYFKVQNTFNNTPSSAPINSTDKPYGTLNEGDSKFQKEANQLKSENQQLVKRTDGLERQIKEYGEMYMSERNEKKDWIAKHDSLQTSLTQTIKQHNKEKTNILKKYYLIFGMNVILAITISIAIAYLLYSSYA